MHCTQVDSGKPLYAWQCQALHAVARNLVHNVRQHHEHEERVVLPWLAARVRHVPAAVAGEHRRAILAALERVREVCRMHLHHEMQLVAMKVGGWVLRCRMQLVGLVIESLPPHEGHGFARGCVGLGPGLAAWICGGILQLRLLVLVVKEVCAGLNLGHCWVTGRQNRASYRGRQRNASAQLRALTVSSQAHEGTSYRLPLTANVARYPTPTSRYLPPGPHAPSPGASRRSTRHGDQPARPGPAAPGGGGAGGPGADADTRHRQRGARAAATHPGGPAHQPHGVAAQAPGEQVRCEEPVADFCC